MASFHLIASSFLLTPQNSVNFMKPYRSPFSKYNSHHNLAGVKHTPVEETSYHWLDFNRTQLKGKEKPFFPVLLLFWTRSPVFCV